MTALSTWRLLITPPLPGALNMALDQAIQESYPAHRRPTLRLYRWQPACVSLGLAQRLARDVDEAACASLGIDVVRRMTGGRAILHEHEVTYSLAIAVDHPVIGSASVRHSYRAISEALCVGLAALGIAPELAPRPQAGVEQSAACFDVPSDYEITLAGRKLVGSAQARKHGVLLQHGSILLKGDVERLARVLRLPATLSPALLAQRLIALDELIAPPPDFDAVVAAITRGWEQHWQIRLEPGQLTPEEEERAAALLRERYGNRDWTARR